VRERQREREGGASEGEIEREEMERNIIET
jgi:hypothetical protein